MSSAEVPAVPVMESWRQMEGTVLDGAVRLGAFLDRAGGSVVFEAEPLPGAGMPSALLVRLIPERTPPEPVLERHLEAMYLSHPHLLRCFGAGSTETPQGRAIYVVVERYDATLSHMLQQRPLTRDEVRVLGVELASALAYLHERGLVCCGLDPSTVVRAGDSWKVGDFSQVRLAGTGYAQETRRLLAGSASVPPEAFEGVVTPAWDSWSLATVLIAAASGPKPDRNEASLTARRSHNKRDLPESVAAVVADCMMADPGQRCGMERIAEALRTGTAAPSQPGAAPEPEPVPEPLAAAAPEPPPAAALEPEAEKPPLRPLETRFRTEEPPRWTWVHKMLAGIGAVIFGAGLAAITLHRSAPDPVTPSAPAAGAEDGAKPNPASPDPETGGAERANDPAAIKSTLNRWIAAARSRDAAALASFYAPRVEAFYGARNVTSDWVRRNRERTFANVRDVRQLDISNVQVRMNGPGQATATFDKSWDFGGRSTGRVRQQVALRQVDGEWRIVSERDTRVYRARSSRGRRSS